MCREPSLRSRLASARAKRTRFASSKALRRSSEVLSGARLNIGGKLYHCNSVCVPLEKTRKVSRPKPVLPEVGCELLERQPRLPDEAPRPDLHRRSPREHELRNVRPACRPADTDHRNPDHPRYLVDRPQCHRLYRQNGAAVPYHLSNGHRTSTEL